jgi:hypothetical protein
MKLQELLADDKKVSELLARTEWVAEGPALDFVEELVYELWKHDRSKAISLYEKYCPYAMKGCPPSFIVHRAIDEGLEFE